MQTWSMKGNNSSNLAGAFLFKSSSRTKDYYCSPECLFYSTLQIIFSLRNFFFRRFIFQWIRYSNVFICFFWLRKVPPIKYKRNWWGMGVVQSAYSCVQGEGVPRFVYTCVLLFSRFWQHFCLNASCFICRNLTLPFFKKDVLVRKGYFFSKRSISI